MLSANTESADNKKNQSKENFWSTPSVPRSHEKSFDDSMH